MSHFSQPLPSSVSAIEKEILKLQERQSKFGNEVTDEAKKMLHRLTKKLEFLKHKEPPRRIQLEEEMSMDTLYLYGVDYMSTKEVKEYFKSFKEPEVTWINDSACRIKFESQDLALNAYKAISMSSHQDDLMNIGEALLDRNQEIDPRNFENEIGWKQAFSYNQRRPNG